MPVLLATLLALTPVTAPRPMPGDICIEVLWELAHTEVLSEAERQHLIENIEPICRQNLVPPPSIPMRLEVDEIWL